MNIESFASAGIVTLRSFFHSMSLHTLRQETARSRDSDVGPVSVPMGPSTPIKEGDEWMRLLGSLKAVRPHRNSLHFIAPQYFLPTLFCYAVLSL